MKLFDEFYRWVSSKAAHGNPLNHVVTTLLSMGIPVDEDAAVWVIAKWLMGGVIVVLPSGVHLNGVPNGEGVRFCDFTSPISRVAGVDAGARYTPEEFLSRDGTLERRARRLAQILTDHLTLVNAT